MLQVILKSTSIWFGKKFLFLAINDVKMISVLIVRQLSLYQFLIRR